MKEWVLPKGDGVLNLGVGARVLIDVVETIPEEGLVLAQAVQGWREGVGLQAFSQVDDPCGNVGDMKRVVFNGRWDNA